MSGPDGGIERSDMLEVCDAVVLYGDDVVLDGVSLAVAPGELVALVGENGCGKSTLGRVLCAMQLVDEGSVLVDGHDPSVSELERLRVRELVGYVQQGPADQIVSSLVFDEVAFGPRNLGLAEDEVSVRVAEALSAVGLSGFDGRVTTELSGGEQQRLALAGVLAMRPSYLVLDEPTAQLDPDSRMSMRELFASLAHEQGAGVVLITHDLLEIGLADRVVALGPEPPIEEIALDGVGPTARVGTTVLELQGVSFAYGDRSVLSGIDLTVRAGEVVLLAGPSGAGKSTLASIATGLQEPGAGTVRVAGEDVRPGMVGLAFQNPEAQFFLDSVYDEIAYAPRNLGFDEDEVGLRVRTAARQVGLDAELLDRYPFELSGGQARRVALASVLSLDAPAYVFDEPSAALDAEGRLFAHRLVNNLATAGKAVVVISHDLDEWRAVATRELRFEAGSLLDEGLTSQRRRESAPEETHVQERANTALACQTRRTGALTPFGAYIPNTVLARIDARVKILLLLATTVGVFAAPSVAWLLPWFAVLAACLAAGRLDPRAVVRGMRPVAIVLAFTLLANMVSCDGHANIALAGTVGISTTGALRGLMAVLRIVLLVGFSLVVASSTTGTQISDACVRLLRPLARVGVPVAALGTVLSLALRFIPLVSEELMRIRLAQRARGAHFDEGPLVQRIGTWASVLTPLIIGLLRRADRLAEAMAARCYDNVC